MYRHLIFIPEIKCHITVVQIIIGEPLLDHVLFITCTDNEVVISVMRIFLHDMPENRFFSDLDHRFRFQMAFFTDTCSVSACQKYYFHIHILPEIASFLIHFIPLCSVHTGN